MKCFDKNEKGFTLVELLAVIVIIGILYLELVPRLDFMADKARESGVKSSFRTFQTSAETYLREIAGSNPTENGLNSYSDDSMKISGGTSNLMDPWKNAYQAQIIKKPNAESLILFRSLGGDNSLSAPGNLYTYTSNGADKDDKLMLVQYKKGVVKSCTKGFGTDIGTMNISGPTGTSTPPVGLDSVTLPQREHYKNMYQYEYAVDVHFSGVTGRAYVYSNRPLDIRMYNGTGGLSDIGGYPDTYYVHFADANGNMVEGFTLWEPQDNPDAAYWNASTFPIVFGPSYSFGLAFKKDDDSTYTNLVRVTDTNTLIPPNTVIDCN